MESPPGRHVDVFPDLNALSRAAAEEFARAASTAVERNGRFSVALSGGNTPKSLYRLLASDFRGQIPWDRVHLFWSDERYVQPGDASSNYSMVRDTLLDRAPVPKSNIHPIPTAPPDPNKAASLYEEILRAFFPTSPPVFDLILLGLGADGHIASLFPGSHALAEQAHWVVAIQADAQPRDRISLTLPVIDSAREVMILVSGKEKRDAVARVLGGGAPQANPLPAMLMKPRGTVHWLLDRAAAGGVSSGGR